VRYGRAVPRRSGCSVALLAGRVPRPPSYSFLGRGVHSGRQLPDHSAYLTHILGPDLVAGVGMGLMLLPITLTATTGIPPENAAPRVRSEITS
jgi:hypothetical protein